MRDEYAEHDCEPPETTTSKVLVGVYVVIGVLVNIEPISELVMLAIECMRADGLPHMQGHPAPGSGQDFYAIHGYPYIGRIAGMFVLFTTFMYGFDNYAKYHGAAWRSPFSRDGPALWQIMVNQYPETGKTIHQRPELWLEATGECFVLCIGVSWVITSIFNPEIFKYNILKSIVGYNNLCVGFDSPPARYAAMPLLVCQAVLASRYSYLDTIRLKATRETLTNTQYRFAYFVNTFFACWMMCFPMLLVITAEFDSWSSTKIHLYLFMGTLFVMWAMLAGNVYEADTEDIELGTKVWFGLLTAHTLLLPVVGILDVLAFHPELNPDQIYTIKYEHPHPPVPWPVCAWLDYGWFLLLLLTIVFLPQAPPIRTRFDCEMAEKYGGGQDGEHFENFVDGGDGTSSDEGSG